MLSGLRTAVRVASRHAEEQSSTTHSGLSIQSELKVLLAKLAHVGVVYDMFEEVRTGIPCFVHQLFESGMSP